MKKVLAKFVCVGKGTDENGTNVNLNVVTSGSEENKSFADATPSGSLHLHISPGKEAANTFEIGKEYLVEITEAPVAANEEVAEEGPANSENNKVEDDQS